MYLIGLMASLATQSPDPSGVVMNLMLKFGWAIPALIIVLFSTFTTTFLDIYSTAISGLNIFPKLGERTGDIDRRNFRDHRRNHLPHPSRLRTFSPLHRGHVLSHSSGSFSLITSF